MNDFSKLIELLSPDKRALLALRLKKEGPKFNIFPLSLAQERLWFVEQLNPGAIFYNISAAMCLTGPLNVPAFEQAFSAVVRRHEVLRIRFEALEGEPFQIVLPAQPLTIPLVALGELNDKEREDATRRLATEKAHQPFDLKQGRLIRALLIKVGEEEHILVVAMHHIVGDAWSVGVLVGELGAMYESYCKGENGEPEELGIQYGDYAVWQRGWMSSEEMEEEKRYWTKHLEGAATVLELPTDRSAPAERSEQAGSRRLVISKEMTGRLNALSKQEGATLFITLLAAFNVMLYRYSGQEDILVGIPIANRNRAGLENLIGLFINTLVIRTNLSGNCAFVDLLKQVRHTTVQAYAHQDLPFQNVVEELRIDRSLSRPPLIQVMFGINHADTPFADFPNLTIRAFEFDNEVTQYDLTLYITAAEQELIASLQYSTDLFDGATIDRMLKHFENLLTDIASNPQRRLSDLSMLSEIERKQLIVEWNDTETAPPLNGNIHGLFEQQAERTPDAIALIYEDEYITYRELNERTNCLAHHLHSLGIGPGVLAGIFLERSIDMVVGVLGILKSGGAYVPLDTSYPEGRLAIILQESEVRLILTHHYLASKLRANKLPLICLDADWEVIFRRSNENLSSSISGDDLAYIIFTSGSTGKPKGVMVSHRSICNRLLAGQAAYELTQSDRVLYVANFCFDISVWEFCAPLLFGASVVLARTDGYKDTAYLAKLITDQRITVAHFVPSLFQLLLEEPGIEHCNSLKCLLTGGDVVPVDLVNRLFSRLDAALYAQYGPTEASINVTCWNCARGGDQQSVAIGRPIANTKIHLLDSSMQLVPVGVPGQLYIGGVALARGYLNHADMTAEKFVPNPLCQNEGERLYKTGDIARYMPGGEIEFLGRADWQVKIRGYRIEVSEVENVLRRHPSIKDVAVVCRQNNQGEKRLAAYLVADRKEIPGRFTPGNAGTIERNKEIELWPSIGEYFVYDTLIYYGLTNDDRRNESYKAAINRSVRDKVVVDIGTGADAILARLCVEGGAKKVYAIEILEESYNQAKRLIHELGLDDKISLINGDVTKVKLPERSDVCVSEIVEAIGGAEGAATIINSARRFLKQRGTLIPRRSVTKIAAITLPEKIYATPSFTEVSAHYVSKIFEQVGYEFDLRLCIKNFPRSNIISNADTFEDLDFTDYVEPEYSREVTLIIDKDSRLDGFLLWLNLIVSDQEMINILEPGYSWFPVHLPVFYPGIQVSNGDIITASCSATLSDNGINPDYSVKGTLIRKDGERIEFRYKSVHHERLYKQSPFYESLFKTGLSPMKQRKDTAELIGSVKEYLKEFLPEYMVPRDYIMIESIPLTPNGKIDRRALPPPLVDTSYLSTSTTQATTPVEEMVAGIWAEVLEVSRVGIDDNFFDLGGHSLLATQVISRVKQTFEVEVQLKSLFEKPGLKEFSQEVEQAIRRGKATAGSIRRSQREGPKPLSYGQQRLWFIDQLESGSRFYNCPGAVRMRGRLEKVALEEALNEVARRHEVLRTRFEVEKGEVVQVVEEHRRERLVEVDLTEMRGESKEREIERVMREEASREFELSKGGLIRRLLIKEGEEEHILEVVMHHIVSDGWSVGVLVKEVGAIYERYSKGEEAELEELEIQYADYAVWQREWMSSEEMEEEKRYWKEQLEGAATVIEMPTDRRRPVVQSYRGGAEGIEIGKELSEGVREISRRGSVTVFMTMLAAFDVLLYRYSGQQDILVGTNVANRTRFETDGLIGFFVNQLVLRADLSGNPTFRELLVRVRKTTLEAYAHQDLPFDKLVDILNPERSLSRAPLFQVKIDFNDVHIPAMNGNGLRLTPVDIEVDSTHLDLILSLTGTPQGIVGTMLYSTDLFNAQTIVGMLEEYKLLLHEIVLQPEARLNVLTEMLAKADANRRIKAEADFKQSRRQKFDDLKRKAAQEFPVENYT